MTKNARILSVADIDLDAIIAGRTAQGGYTPSPSAWEDETLYFLLLDRYSDGGEAGVLDADGETVSDGTRPCFVPQKHAGNAVKGERAARWRESGNTFTGGKLRGLTQKIGYIKRLGITAIWVSPVLKQATFAKSDYHGYGTQNFYEIEPRFGTREDLRELVDTAHANGIKVILDIILNHCCDAFEYDGDANRAWSGETYPVKAFRNRDGIPNIPFKPLNGTKYINSAVWPRELQAPENFTRKGSMNNWDNWPEYEEGDFFGFKDFALGTATGGGKSEEDDDKPTQCEADDPSFQPSPALIALTEIYKYWIAFADLDGFRIDTVKHMGPGPAGYFVQQIKAFTKAIGKSNFFLIGEIAGGRAHAHWMLAKTGLDAALGIDEIPGRMRGVVRGEVSPCEYFSMFVNTRKEEKQTGDPNWWRDRVVTFFDDHDQVGTSVKGRFAAAFGGDGKKSVAGLIRALAFNVLTLGIPCVYYGTEQGFDGHAMDAGAGDRYLREAMHGAAFGSFGSKGAHFFNEKSRIYSELAKILELRKSHAALRRGRQYLRPISPHGETFYEPERIGEPYRGIVAWSRILDTDECVCALNTDEEKSQTVWVTLDPRKHKPGDCALHCLYSTSEAQVGEETDIPEARNGAAVRITVPAGGFVIYR